MAPNQTLGRAHGKVVLLGEHAVVHGVPALAASVGRGASATARPADVPSLCIIDASDHATDKASEPRSIDANAELLRAFRALCDATGVCASAEVRIDVPLGAGLGSSASLGVALARALLSLRGTAFDDEQVVEVASAWERVFHGNPSGVDVAVATYGGCIAFSRSEGVRRLSLKEPVPLCIGDTGTRSSTRAMVQRVGELLRQHKDDGRGVLDGIRACVCAARDPLMAGNWHDVAAAMNENQRWLGSLGLNTVDSDVLCGVAMSAGALGAKLTGAGGGGCVIALAPGRREEVVRAWRLAGYGGFVADAGN